MHGFISESTSKISDGLWSAVQLLLLNMFAGLLSQLFSRHFPSKHNILLALLMAGAIFCLSRTLVIRFPETKKAMYGMVAGLLFWQAVSVSGLPEGWVFFQTGGYLLWLSSAILVTILWQKVLPTGMRFTLLVLMIHWLGRLFFGFLSQFPGANLFGFGLVRLLGGFGFLASLWFIVIRSANPLQRRYAAVGLYASFLLTFFMLK